MQLVYICDKCRAAITIYHGDPVGIPFARLPEAIVAADNHPCEEA